VARRRVEHETVALAALRQGEDAQAGQRGPDRGNDPRPLLTRQAQGQDEDVGLERTALLDRLFESGRLAHDLEVPLALEQPHDAAPVDRLVVGHHDPDAAALGGGAPGGACRGAIAT